MVWQHSTGSTIWHHRVWFHRAYLAEIRHSTLQESAKQYNLGSETEANLGVVANGEEGAIHNIRRTFATMIRDNFFVRVFNRYRQIFEIIYVEISHIPMVL